MLLYKLFYIPIIISSFILSLPYILYLISISSIDNLFASIQDSDILPTRLMISLQSMSNCLIIAKSQIINSWIGVSTIRLLTYVNQKLFKKN